MNLGVAASRESAAGNGLEDWRRSAENSAETPLRNDGSCRASFRVRTCIGTMNDECAKVLLPLLRGEGRGEGGIAVHGSW
jgi:hypothetical protein